MYKMICSTGSFWEGYTIRSTLLYYINVQTENRLILYPGMRFIDILWHNDAQYLVAILEMQKA